MQTSGREQVRLGIILPDDPIESELKHLDRWLAGRGCEDVTALTLLSEITGGHFETVLRQAGDLSVIGPVARRLAQQGCDAVIWACTSGSFIGGLDWAGKQAQGLEEAAARPASSTTLAFIAALKALGADRAHLLAAYPQAATRAFIQTLADAGIRVDRWVALESPDGASSFKLSLADEVRRFSRTLPEDEAPLLVPDTAINSLDLVDELEALAGRMVLTANQVTLWHGLNLLGVSPRVPRAGRLLAMNLSPGKA